MVVLSFIMSAISKSIKISKPILWIILISVILSSSGTFVILQFSFIIFLIYSIYYKPKLIHLIISSLIFVFAIFVGFGNKFNFDFKLMSIALSSDYVINTILWRCSTMYRSLSYFINNDMNYDLFSILFNESLNRLDSILYINVDESVIRSVSRINYLSIFTDNTHLFLEHHPDYFQVL